jgi:hypothetical protein
MIDLKRISKGRREEPHRILIYSFDGVGKTQFAAGSPDAFFVDANKGSLKHDVARVMVNDWDETKEYVTAVENGQIKCKTLVLDSITDLEAMSHAKLFGNETIGEYAGGYGRGEEVAVAEWRVFYAQLERIWAQGKNLILIAHAMVRSFDDPTGPKFDRFEVSARPRLSGMLRQKADFVFFAREETMASKSKNQSTKATTTGVRWMYTKRTPAYDAKSRGTSLFPDRILLGWSDFEAAVRNDGKRGADLTGEIEEMLAEISDAELTKECRAYMKSYPAAIVEAHNRVTARLEEFRQKGQAATQQAPTATPDGAKTAQAAS